MSDDLPISQPTLVHSTAAGVVHAGRAVNGVHFLEPAGTPGLFVASVDLAGGALAAPPEAIALPAYSIPGNPTWSRDGTRLAFTLKILNRLEHRVMVSEGVRGIHREIARVDLRVLGLEWSADGKFLVIGGRAETRGSAWVGRIDVASGAIDRIAAGPRFHVHFTPTYGSWLNLVERWFAELTNKQLRRGVHRSVRALETAIREFVDAHNADGKPFVWTKSADEILASIARFAQRTLDFQAAPLIARTTRSGH